MPAAGYAYAFPLRSKYLFEQGRSHSLVETPIYRVSKTEPDTRFIAFL
ncbi:hypothetical protein [Desmonostoc muscorum]|nr:hypothetical protein [Desmonostoc muscorum]